MIEITIVEQQGRVFRVISRGHAVRPEAGESAPCAAVSVLLQSFGLTLIDNGCVVEGSVDRPGHFDLTCRQCENPDWYRGVSEITLGVIESIQRSWPDQIRLTIQKE